jgi:asparagine synthase (glutamine-hydrolysing)
MAFMCGLLTFVSARGDAAAHRDAVSDALESIRHRGPDDSHVVVVGGDVVAGANRLAVNDVTHGRQPLAYPPDGPHVGRYLVVFDGALYNAAELRAELREAHAASFATEGDAEVVAAAYHFWGPSAVNRLRGMFAFVIWDGSARRAFGARDPYGIKPLFHLVTPGGAYFASEKKALLAFDDEALLDTANLQHYFSMQYVPEPGTLHRGIARLGAGESFVYPPGGPLANRRYSDLALRPAPAAEEPEIYARVRAALRDSVRAHLRADAPVGAFLSSGIDSTAIVALAREVEPSLPTFTVGYDVDGYSEIEVAERTAADLGLRLKSTVVSAEDMMRALPRIVWHLDDPVADPALVPLFFLAEAASRDVSVVLSGDGADEVFGGYGIYREPFSLSALSGLPDPMQRGLRAVSRAIPQGVRGKSFLERGTTPIEERYYGNARIFSEDEKATLLRGYDPSVRHTAVTAPVFAEVPDLDDVSTMQYVDLYTWLRGDILVKADRMSMAHSLQLRTPFLDRAVFEVAATLPTELKVPAHGHETKLALRRAMAGLVPDAIVDRKKLGFPTPIRPWLRGPMYEWADDLLARSGAGDLIDLEYVRGLLRAHRGKHGDQSRKVWAVLVFCVWHAIFVAGTLEPAIPEPLRDLRPQRLGQS